MYNIVLVVKYKSCAQDQLVLHWVIPEKIHTPPTDGRRSGCFFLLSKNWQTQNKHGPSAIYKLLTNQASLRRTGEHWCLVIFAHNLGQYSPVQPLQLLVRVSFKENIGRKVGDFSRLVEIVNLLCVEPLLKPCRLITHF